MPESATFVDDQHLRIGTTDFYCAFPFDDAPAGFLQVMKGRELVERYIELGRELRPRIVVELGIRRGGSTAMLSELLAPDTLVAVELEARPAPALRAYIAERGLTEVVRTHYGVDQADRPRLEQILDDDIGDRAIDLVIDDASHRYAETRSSFDLLFPRVRPGGQFVIEDWNGRHLVADQMAAALRDTTRPDHDEVEQRITAAVDAQLADAGQTEIPLTRLCMEFLLARASAGDVIRSVAVNRHWIVVERGADPLDKHTFRLADHVHDHAGLLSPFDGAAS
jgi:predicted O-methyltransferase YrrM